MKSNNSKVKENGITLVSLVITIIILLILAGITINMTLGENGIFTKAKQAKENFLLAANIEEESLRNAELMLEGSTIGGNDEGGPSGVSKLKVGDYVDYDPTKADANKTVDVDANLLSYTSYIGGFDSNGKAISGNGITEQEFTAVSSSSGSSPLMWRVLFAEEENVILIPDKSVLTNNGNPLILRYSFGYMFAEEELHNIASIYGHGYGAKTDITYKYYVGGPLDTPIEKEITNTAARSITLRDLYRLVDMEPSTNYRWDGTTTMTGVDPTVPVYYPSLSDCNKTGTGTLLGRSNTKKNPFTSNTFYDNDEDWSLMGQKIKQLLPLDASSKAFHIANRMCTSYNVNASFQVIYYNLEKAQINSNDTAYGGESGVGNALQQASGVLPVVTINRNVIEENAKGSEWGTKEQPWKLK